MTAAMAARPKRRHWHTDSDFHYWCGPCRYERRIADGRLLFLIVMALVVTALAFGLAGQVVADQEQPRKRYVPIGEVIWR